MEWDDLPEKLRFLKAMGLESILPNPFNFVVHLLAAYDFFGHSSVSPHHSEEVLPMFPYAHHTYEIGLSVVSYR